MLVSEERGKNQSINNRITTSKLLKLFDFAAHRHKLIFFCLVRVWAHKQSKLFAIYLKILQSSLWCMLKICNRIGKFSEKLNWKCLCKARENSKSKQMHHIHQHRKPQAEFIQGVYTNWFMQAIFPLSVLTHETWMEGKFIKAFSPTFAQFLEWYQ